MKVHGGVGIKFQLFFNSAIGGKELSPSGYSRFAHTESDTDKH